MSKKSILKALKRCNVEIIALGAGDDAVNVELRELSYKKLQKVIKGQSADKEDEESQLAFGARLLAACLYSPDGERVFDDGDEARESIDDMGMTTFRMLSDKAIALHGIGKDEGNGKAESA